MSYQSNSLGNGHLHGFPVTGNRQVANSNTSSGTEGQPVSKLQGREVAYMPQPSPLAHLQGVGAMIHHPLTIPSVDNLNSNVQMQWLCQPNPNPMRRLDSVLAVQALHSLSLPTNLPSPQGNQTTKRMHDGNSELPALKRRKSENVVSAEVLEMIQHKNGSIEFCSVVDGKLQGDATQKFRDGSVEKFTYVEGKRQGEATRTYPGGSVQKFTYVDSKSQGEITRTFSDGSVLKGTCVDGRAQGEATRTYPDGSVEKFTCVDGRAQGEGTKTYPDGTALKLTYLDGRAQGEGTKTYSDGSVEKFTFVDGKLQGEATRTYPDGSVEKFTCVDGKKQGKATYTYPDGTALKFTYLDGQRHGEATLEGRFKLTYERGKPNFDLSNCHKYL